MSQDNPQPVEPGTPPDTTVSQQGAAAVASPDTIESFPNPMDKKVGDDRDYEASYKGLSKRYNEDKVAWESKGEEYKGQVDALSQKFLELEQKLMDNPQPEPQEPEAPEQVSDDGTPDFLSAMAEAEGIRLRDKLLFEKLGESPAAIGLAQFRENIPVVPPTLNDDGTVDDSGQRKAIDDFAAALQGVAKKSQESTQQAMTQGWTPGVSPGAPTEESYDSQVAEYYKIKEFMGTAEFQGLSPTEQNRTSQEYYSMHDKIGKHLPHQSAPWMDGNELSEAIRQVQGRVGHLEDNFIMPKS